MKFYVGIHTSAGRFSLPIEANDTNQVELDLSSWARGNDPLVACDDDGIRMLVWPQPGMALTISNEEQRQKHLARAAAQAQAQAHAPILQVPGLPGGVRMIPTQGKRRR